MKKLFVDQNNAVSRPTGVYGDVIRDIAKDGVCPFCSESLSKYHNKPLAEKRFWWVTDSRYPYSPVHHHCLIIHKEHITHIDELSSEAWSELNEILKQETQVRKIAGGTLMLRFGETCFTGASVSHLHAHLVQSNPDDPSYDSEKGLAIRIG